MTFNYIVGLGLYMGVVDKKQHQLHPFNKHSCVIFLVLQMHLTSDADCLSTKNLVLSVVTYQSNYQTSLIDDNVFYILLD